MLSIIQLKPQCLLKRFVPLLVGVPFIVCFSSDSWARGLEIIPRGSLGFSYDSNVGYDKKNGLSDFVTQLDAGLDVGREGKYSQWKGQFDIIERIYADNSKFTNTSESLFLDYLKELTKTQKLALSEKFDHYYEPLTFEDAFGLRTTGRFERYRNLLSLEHEQEFTNTLKVFSRLGNEVYLVNNADVPDSYLNTAGVQLEYAKWPDLIGLFRYRFDWRIYEGGDDALNNFIQPGFRKYLTKQLYLETLVGANILRAVNGETFTKPAIEVSLNDQVNEITVAGIGYRKDYQSSGFANDTFNEWRISGFCNKNLSRRVTGATQIFYGEGEYIDQGTSDKLSGVELGLLYDFKENWKGTISYAYTRVDSTSDTRGYTKNVVMVGLNFKL